MDWAEIGKWVLAAIAAAIGVGLVIKLSVSKKSTTTNTTQKVTQNKNVAGGDIVGGDKIDNSRR